MSRNHAADRHNRPGTAFWILLLLLVTVPLSGCGGCSGDSDADQAAKAKSEKKKKDDEQKKKEEEKKKDFEISEANVEPFDPDKPLPSVKPGHWFSVSQAMKTNNFDFVGEMASDLTLRATGRPMEQTPIHLMTSRPVVLPKGQERYPELPVYIPRRQMAENGVGDANSADASPQTFVSGLSLSTELRTRGGGGMIMSKGTPLVLMPPYQFYFFVLAREHLRYRPLEGLDALRGPEFDGRLVYYRFVLPPLEKHVALPAHPLAWTSIAYVLWDDVDPALLSPDQQRAMLDWLHWGGQLLLSGPNTLGTLRGSFLGPYLPASEGPTREISAEALLPLSNYFTPKQGKGHRPLSPIHAWSGIQLVKAPEAVFLPHTGDLVVERGVGRGRIVATAFPLSLRALQAWPGFDSFLNASLLRHPPREFVAGEGLDPERAVWLEHPKQVFDARLTCGLRYLSRDLAADGNFAEDRVANSPQSIDPLLDRAATTPVAMKRTGVNTGLDSAAELSDSLDAEGSYGAGVGGWSDSSAVSAAAQGALGDAAGIDIPRAGFVAWMLAAYLVVLVPVNWGLFKALRRVEWAWVAVPLIALAGAVVVTKAANLNIGFARSQTEIGVLELQSGYPRGHLTRYTALYTSLSTSYDVRFNDPYALVRPMALESQVRPGATWEPTTYAIRQEADLRLGGFGVSSNSTAMLHSEQMLDLPGAISCSATDGPPMVYNRTGLTFDQAGLVRVQSGGELQAAWLGPFAPGEAGRQLEFRTVSADSPPLPQWRDDPVAAPGIPPLSLRKVVAMVTERNGLKPGEMRLVASLSQPISGMEVDPAASQATRAAVLVVVHLRYAPRDEPLADRNSRQEPVPSIREEPLDPDAPPANAGSGS
ncbi:MAG TPA: hypothetical protein VG056_10385 [Pirellulales bacterium]|jgi:hypothetical protein|nr:hypothetical protein [Pirellulales bacterium]